MRGMSPSEVAWRTGNLTRDVVDVARMRLGFLPPSPTLHAGESIREAKRGFSLDRAAEQFERLDLNHAWRVELTRAADEILAGNLSYFNLERYPLGNPIDWHRDHSSGISSSRKLIQRIDYRDFAANGDCKQVWEPNRHHQFVVLARAYSTTNEVRYAEALLRQMSAWIADNPYGYGMNWRSPLELGVRVINWVFALELIRESGLLYGARWEAIYRMIHIHCWEIYRKISKGSSANNHLIGELAGVFVAASYLPDLPGARQMITECRSSLVREIERQAFEDGCNREHALGYQFFVIQFYLISGLVGRWTGNDFPPAYFSRLHAMFEFVAAVAEAGPLPMFGDQDDGYVLDLGDSAQDVAALMGIGRELFDLSDVGRQLATRSESTYWLLGQVSDGVPEGSGAHKGSPSVAFPASGYYQLQSRRGRNSISLFFDCAELGYGAIAAHGHADALSFTLRAHNEYLLIDPGTYDYFTYPAWRDYFRTTAAHNTVVIDGFDQSDMQGPFMWGKRATALCLEWKTDERHSTVTGEHDGYTRLADPVVHRRTLTLSHDEFHCSVVDRLIASGDHLVNVYFHLGPLCEVRDLLPSGLVIDVNRRFKFVLRLDPRLEVETLRGSEKPIAGWYSPGYHRKMPITTVIGTMRSSGEVTLEHRIEVERVD
jgi:hypothetical protein